MSEKNQGNMSGALSLSNNITISDPDIAGHRGTRALRHTAQTHMEAPNKDAARRRPGNGSLGLRADQQSKQAEHHGLRNKDSRETRESSISTMG